MTKKFHFALSVASLEASVSDYTERLGKKPELIIPHTYALWRTELVNFSIREEPEKAGQLRHIGFEDANAVAFTKSTDVNGVLWEHFAASQQEQEIKNIWPKTDYTVR